MFVTVEISYYPLVNDIDQPVYSFIEKIKGEGIIVETGTMSTLVSGDYIKVMDVLTSTMGEIMVKYPSVFNIKLSNACGV